MKSIWKAESWIDLDRFTLIYFDLLGILLQMVIVPMLVPSLFKLDL